MLMCLIFSITNNVVLSFFFFLHKHFSHSDGFLKRYTLLGMTVKSEIYIFEALSAILDLFIGIYS